jgi:predicted nucleotidyltransferase
VKQPRSDFLEILRALRAREVDFIVVGGVSGVLHGAPITTIDLDLVHSRSGANIDRLLLALADLEAFARGRGEQRIRPDRSHLESPGHQLLTTKHGPLDLLGAVQGGRGYDDLLAHTVEMTLGPLAIRVIDLDTLIDLKEHLGREKDLAVIAVLKRTRDEARKRGKP